MFVNTQHTVNTLGVNRLVDYANGRFSIGFDAQDITDNDIKTALLATPETDIQTTVFNWFETASTNVNNTIAGYVAKLELTQAEVDASLLLGISADLMRYELCNNDADEGLMVRRKNAMQELGKIEAGTIQIKAPSPVASGPIQTKTPSSSFDWARY
ncbi:DUF1320 family protein [Pseudoalteromonas luteoviolacea]|uniref:phage protein Gp36 family protein n=1 Tax=Pseudoalteromonas luteoviolacea TaxID=43657 RepID=UPI001B3A767C|nr:phage protein Gp36 family protein [Pseudoalteromonas luteoviolacea]MBQ4879643.1 DUF1320 family protein [Pseudoalteromonas luteoviolacea]MBQ4909173.1 DUF1320 family protein [Pseudoalteromonas luteoviolacea]